MKIKTSCRIKSLIDSLCSDNAAILRVNAPLPPAASDKIGMTSSLILFLLYFLEMTTISSVWILMLLWSFLGTVVSLNGMISSLGG